MGSPLRLLGSVGLVAVAGSMAVFANLAACSNDPPPKSPEPSGSNAAASVGTTMTPCSDAPGNPIEVVAKEPKVVSECFQSMAKGGAAPPCGHAKIAVEVGKDGRLIRADVADSTLPPGVTDCIKARLAALQYACPKEGSATYTVPVGLPTGGAGGCAGAPATGLVPGLPTQIVPTTIVPNIMPSVPAIPPPTGT